MKVDFNRVLKIVDVHPVHFEILKDIEPLFKSKGLSDICLYESYRDMFLIVSGIHVYVHRFSDDELKTFISKNVNSDNNLSFGYQVIIDMYNNISNTMIKLNFSIDDVFSILSVFCRHCVGCQDWFPSMTSVDRVINLYNWLSEYDYRNINQLSVKYRLNKITMKRILNKYNKQR